MQKRTYNILKRKEELETVSLIQLNSIMVLKKEIGYGLWKSLLQLKCAHDMILEFAWA